MHPRVLTLLSALLIAALWAHPAVADEEIITLAIENDSFGGGTDSYYTNGARLSYLNAEKNAPPLAQWVADKVPMFRGDPLKGYTLSLGQNMYTPENIRIAAPQPNDRPWAGFTYLSMGMAAGDPASVVDELELTLGIVGPASFAEQTQTLVHRNVGAPRPAGWAHQLRNEPVANIAWQRRWPRTWSHPIGSTLLSFTPNLSAAAGNAYTHAGAGGMLRWSTNPAALVDNPVRVRPSMPGTGYFQATAHPNIVLFAGAEERAVARNIFLDGNTFTDSASVRKRNFVTDLQAGAVLTWQNYQVGYTAVYRSKEFFGQDDGQLFGALSFAYRF